MVLTNVVSFVCGNNGCTRKIVIAFQIPHIVFVDNLMRMNRRKLTVFASNYVCYIILFFPPIFTLLRDNKLVILQLPRGTHEWSCFLTPEELVLILQRANISVCKIV
jgi:2-polyprenyl-3-methyl-5-hydroxy-6-metoxy-1,4-benzoquinol methylase